MSRDDRRRWSERYHSHDRAHLEAAREAPEPFLVEHAPLLHVGRTLDLAAGNGRNGLFLAQAGHHVVAADVAIQALQEIRYLDPAVALVHVDLDQPCFRSRAFDNVVCVNFLDRRLFAEIYRWLRPGGALLFDTFLIDQRHVGHPRNPDFLLGRGELLERAKGYRVLRYREGPVDHGGRVSLRAGIVALRED
jgi:SAM-dependent methyltransferase